MFVSTALQRENAYGKFITEFRSEFSRGEDEQQQDDEEDTER